MKEDVIVIAYKKGNNYIVDTENNIAKIELKRTNKESVWAIIDLEDLDKVINFPYTWHTYSKKNLPDVFYANATEQLGYDENHIWRNRTVPIHDIILNLTDHTNIEVDHIDHNTLDNRKNNLRITAIKENSRNRKGKNRNNISGYRNVSYIKRSKYPYWVQIMVGGRNECLGKFDDVEEAAKFAEEMRQKHYGEFAGEA